MGHEAKTQRVVICFLIKNGVNTSENVQSLQGVLAKAAESKNTVYLSVNFCKADGTTLENDSPHGRVCTFGKK